uniref:Putative lipid exporter abca1 n=1 Tax=Anopheles triannulatus TaxID=58253 RepID=A0A2M4A4P2_9DIPT
MSKYLKLFVGKTLKEKICHFVRNLLNTLFPVLFLLAVVLLGNRLSSVDESIDINLNQDELVDYFPGEPINKIYYTPQTTLVEELIEEVRRTLSVIDERVESFSSDSELERALLNNANLCFGISFHNASLEGRLRYTIRTKNNNFRTDVIYSRDVFDSYSKRDNEYIESGFLALQNAIDRAFIARVTLTGNAERDRVTLQYGHVPLLADKGPQEAARVSLALGLVSVCFTVCSTYLLLLPLVEERACGMNEHLKLACLESYWNELAIFLVTFIHFFAIMAVCIAIGAFGRIWDNNPAQIIYLIILAIVFLVNLITFTFLMSATLESATIASAIAPVCYFASVLVSFIRGGLAPFLVIFPVNGLLYGASIFHNFKSSGHSFEAGDLFTSGYPGMEELSLFGLLNCMVLGCILWSFLWFYVTNVFPGRYGTPKSKSFFLSRKYWSRLRMTICATNSNRVSITSWQNPTSARAGEGALEEIGLQQEACARPIEQAAHLEKLIGISKLNKVFKSRSSGAAAKVAVKDFSLSIYGHSITVLLGHNGAGKTTTMNIITGMVARTSGSITVDGEYDPDRYRQQIGFCPQHNVSFPYLNCREHLEFFGRLRGMEATEARQEAEQILEKVNLLEKADCKIPTLSGGMKRRLNLANAIIGRTKLLILDEPTSGLDPESRRDIWDVLLRLRHDHTILLTTHFMEEADILGDWIAIMAYGELLAFGSPMFLKQQYGKGYTLKLLKRATGLDWQATLALIRQYVPDAIERSAVQQVCAVTLPYDAIERYADLLKELELQKERLGIEAISINNATLEEVFLNSSSTQNRAFQRHQESLDFIDGDASGSTHSNADSMANSGRKQSEMASRCSAFWDCFVAIWVKKLIHIKRNVHVYGCLTALPLIVTFCCFAVGSANDEAASTLPAVDLHAGPIQNALGFIVINRGAGNAIAANQQLNKNAIESIVSGIIPGGIELIVLENVSLIERLREESNRDYTAYRDRVVVGIEFNVTDTTDVTVLHNNNLVHSSGIAQSLATTLLLRYYYGLADALVEVQNIPATRNKLIDLRTPLFFTEFISIAFMFSVLQFLQVPLLERLSGFRQLQNIKRHYWAATLAFDFTLHLILCLLVVILAFMLDKERVFSAESYRLIFSVLLLYGLYALVVVYIVSQTVDSANTAMTVMSYLMIAAVAGVFLLSDGYDNIKQNSVSIYALHVVPEFALKHSMRVIYENQKLTAYESLSNKRTGGQNHKEAIFPTAFFVVSPIVAIILAIVLDVIVENKINRERFNENMVKIGTLKRRITFRKPAAGGSGESPSDMETGNGRHGRDVTDSSPTSYDDVDRESDTVNQLYVQEGNSDNEDQYALVVKNVRKNYGTHGAVNGISFAVKKGECFGLLGMNGAGKTTMFQMVSGNLPPSQGEIYLQGKKLDLNNEETYREKYGYCPQLDALLDFMTVHQVIDYFARLKGIPNREKEIHRYLSNLDIIEYMDHELRECSGGTKRKVNTILALIGNPSVVLLDEPTTGVDPNSRQFLWKSIKTIQRHNQTVLLTSHSMDECEELCDRLSIMVRGRLRCIGLIPQLKQRHGQGFNLLFKLQSAFIVAEDSHEEYVQLIELIKDRFNATLQEEHKGMLKFLVSPTLKLSELFAQAEALKNERSDQIASYSINESSLEDIFLRFQKKHRRLASAF